MFAGRGRKQPTSEKHVVLAALLSLESARRLRLGLLGLVRGDGEGHGDDESEGGELHVVSDGTCIDR